MVSCSVGEEVDGQIDSSHWGDIDGLFSNNTSSSDSGGVLSGASHLYGIYENFQWVSAGQKVYNFEGVSDDSDSLDFLSCIST